MNSSSSRLASFFFETYAIIIIMNCDSMEMLSSRLFASLFVNHNWFSVGLSRLGVIHSADECEPVMDHATNYDSIMMAVFLSQLCSLN